MLDMSNLQGIDLEYRSLYSTTNSPTTMGGYFNGLYFRHAMNTEVQILIFLVDIFSKIPHFILYKISNDASQVVNIFFTEIARLHKIPKSITYDRDSKFILHTFSKYYEKDLTHF